MFLQTQKLCYDNNLDKTSLGLWKTIQTISAFAQNQVIVIKSACQKDENNNSLFDHFFCYGPYFCRVDFYELGPNARSIVPNLAI